jgi:hypothetical protein
VTGEHGRPLGSKVLFIVMNEEAALNPQWLIDEKAAPAPRVLEPRGWDSRWVVSNSREGFIISEHWRSAVTAIASCARGHAEMEASYLTRPVLAISCFILLSAALCGCDWQAQETAETALQDPLRGIYSVCDPMSDSQTVRVYRGQDMETRSVGQILGSSLKDIDILEVHGDWMSAEQAKKQMLAFLQTDENEAVSQPVWNVDWPIDIRGRLEFHDGSRSVVASANHRVCFQDRAGRTWYIQWNERLEGQHSP